VGIEPDLAQARHHPRLLEHKGELTVHPFQHV
jgi:hypothetical protein